MCSKVKAQLRDDCMHASSRIENGLGEVSIACRNPSKNEILSASPYRRLWPELAFCLSATVTPSLFVFLWYTLEGNRSWIFS